MKSLFLTIFTLLVFAPAFAQEQTLPPSFSFAREDNKQGSFDYVLMPVVEEVHKKIGGDDKPYQILTALARYESQRAVLMFANAQKDFQLATQEDKSVVITADGREFKNKEYKLAGKSEPDRPIKLEIANVIVSFQDFEKIINAKSITVKFGAVTYKLDKDNINALHYVAAEIVKDHKTR